LENQWIALFHSRTCFQNFTDCGNAASHRWDEFAWLSVGSQFTITSVRRRQLGLPEQTADKGMVVREPAGLLEVIDKSAWLIQECARKGAGTARPRSE